MRRICDSLALLTEKKISLWQRARCVTMVQSSGRESSVKTLELPQRPWLNLASSSLGVLIEVSPIAYFVSN